MVKAIAGRSGLVPQWHSSSVPFSLQSGRNAMRCNLMRDGHIAATAPGACTSTQKRPRSRRTSPAPAMTRRERRLAPVARLPEGLVRPKPCTGQALAGDLPMHRHDLDGQHYNR